jgi:hypothetical protein
MTKRPWQEVIDEQVPVVMKQFYSPLVDTRVVLEEELASGTAHFDFRDNTTHAQESFLDDLVDAGLSQEVAVRSIIKHEFGHYHIYPKECDVLMFLYHFAQHQFGKYTKPVVAYWIDVLDNLPQILKKKSGQDIRDLYRTMNAMGEERFVVTPPVRELLEALEIDADEYVDVLRTYSVDRLVTAYYQRQGGEDLGVDLSDNEYLSGKLDELMAINFLDQACEISNFVLFGTVVSDVLKELEAHLPKIPEDLLQKLLAPYIADAPELDEFTDKQIQEGLDKIIKRWGRKRYERIKDYVEKETGRKLDQPREPGKGLQAGMGSSELKFHDDDIPYYDRLSRIHGVYIHRKPVVVDVHDKYPQGQERFRVGDSVRRLNRYSTGGKVLPGITTRYREGAGTRKDNMFKVPNLSLWMDTSGSMSGNWLHYARLAGFILARNYHVNGAEVGVVNFSTDTAFLLPTRELDEAYSMICAYWGGGTILNIPKIQEYVERIAERGRDSTVERMYTTEEDYQRLVDRMSPEQQRAFVEKHLTVDLKGEVRTTYDKLDTAIITDGGIGNLDEVVAYINQTATVSRNTIFLVGRDDLGDWDQLHLPNTQIIPVNKPDDLIGCVIGDVRNLVPEEQKPASLFYKG